MADAVVVDASPLILLARAEALDLLVDAFAEVILPTAVVTEVQAKPDDPAAILLADESWYRIVDEVPNPRRFSELGLGAGESSVLALAASHDDILALLDDRRARRVASELGISVVGTLGLVLAAKDRGAIPAARLVIDRLVGSGMYLAPETIRDALALVGE